MEPIKTDTELVYIVQTTKNLKTWQDATYEIWKRYIRLIYKSRWSLQRLCLRNHFNMEDVLEDYESIFWEKFVPSLYGVRLNEAGENFSLYIRLKGYLQSLNRDLVRAYMKEQMLNVGGDNPIDYEEEGPTVFDTFSYSRYINQLENDFEYQEIKKIFWAGMERLKQEVSQTQRIIMGMKVQGLKPMQIARKLKIKQRQVLQNIEDAKQKFVAIIEDEAKKAGYPDYNYDDLVKQLT